VTSVQRRSQPTAAAEPTGRQLHRVLVGLIVGDTQFGVVVDAVAPVAMQITALVDLVKRPLSEIGLERLQAGKRGRWAMCWMDGTPLRPAGRWPSRAWWSLRTSLGKMALASRQLLLMCRKWLVRCRIHGSSQVHRAPRPKTGSRLLAYQLLRTRRP